MSTIIAANISDGTTSVPSTYVVNGSAKAWANINQTSAQAIRDSFNIASITDGGAGSTRLTFTSAMGNGNFAVVNSCGVNATYGDNSCGAAVSTTQYDVYSENGTNYSADNTHAQSVIFGDLA